MISTPDLVTCSSSTLLRFLSYGFLRWVPGHPFPPLIASLAVVYFISFGICFVTTPAYKIIEDRVDVVTHAVENGDLDALNARKRNRASARKEPIEELDVREIITLEARPPYLLRTLLSGLPSPTSLIYSLATSAINLACVAMVMDMTYRGAQLYPSHDLSFARLGYVSESSAKILVREPNVGKLPVVLSYRDVDAVNPKAKNAWKQAGSISWLSDETDYTTSMEIRHLRSDNRYEYALSSNHSGFFITAPAPGQASNRNHGKFTFLHTSCIKARFPYNPLSHPLSIPGAKHLSRWLSILKPRFLIFLGDFIYVDVPRRFGIDYSTYRREYRQVYASPDWPSIAKTEEYDIPWLHVYDDHEIANDWDKGTTGVFSAAFEPYNNYHVSVNPPRYRPKQPNSTYFAFNQGPAAFFMLDTRRFRDSSTATDPYDPTKSMLGKEQLSDFLRWLRKPEPEHIRWKIVVSSVPFTKNWRFNAQDTWSGYLAERKIVLEAMWDLSLANSPIGVVILSGDRHEFAATAFPPPPPATVVAEPGISLHPKSGHWPSHATVHEFSASPMNMFYLPFRTYKQTDLEDVCLKYIPDGNSKFGAIEIEAPTGSEQSILRYRLFVDGEEAWSHLLLTPPKIDGVGGRAMRDGIWG